MALATAAGEAIGPMIILIDNYDSFSYNLYQLVGTIEPGYQSDHGMMNLTVDEIRALKPSADHSFTGTGLSKRMQGICDRSRQRHWEKRYRHWVSAWDIRLSAKPIGASRFLCKRADARQAVHDNH